MSIIPDQQSPAQYIGELLGATIFNIAISYWFLFTINTLCKTNFPYDFAHVFSSYFITTNINSLIKKK
jgi:hypothetical protein